MAEIEKPLDIRHYIDLGLRRKWYIIVPLVIGILASYAVYKKLPKIYRATTLILVQPQTIPESYIRPTITDTIAGRLNTLSQEILSRTRLERVINELNLYSDLRPKMPMEAIVEIMRKSIEVKVQSSPQYERGQNSFTLSYEGREPTQVMEVINKLASLFIEENLRVRELRAEKTADFLRRELEAMESKLRRKDEEIRIVKERYMGQLPEQLDANLRVLERLQEQLKTTSENIRAAEDRMILLRNQIEQLKERSRLTASRGTRIEGVPETEGAGQEQGPEDPLITQWNSLNRELAAALSRYTENHPDVIDLKRKIANLEPKVKDLVERQKAAKEARQRELIARRQAGSAESTLPSGLDPVTERLVTQYQDQYNEAQIESRRLRGEERNLKEQIALYQKRIEDTPKREQELANLTRDYDLLKASYQSLLDKKIQAQMAESLEKKQQGEQFRILDPARVPEKPVRPDRNRILLIGTMLGLAVGLGLAWLKETLDQSFHAVSEVETYLGVPVLATIPNLREEKPFYYGRRSKSIERGAESREQRAI